MNIVIRLIIILTFSLAGIFASAFVGPLNICISSYCRIDENYMVLALQQNIYMGIMSALFSCLSAHFVKINLRAVTLIIFLALLIFCTLLGIGEPEFPNNVL